jgi:hypothetical protein
VGGEDQAVAVAVGPVVPRLDEPVPLRRRPLRRAAGGRVTIADDGQRRRSL